VKLAIVGFTRKHDPERRSRISYADFAVAFVSELEGGRHVRHAMRPARPK
jgi:putative NADH-flavin reductase